MDTESEEFEIFRNTSISTFSWTKCTVMVKDRKAKTSRPILESVEGIARAGQMLALMGPSGSGKTTLLNLLARRFMGKNARTEGEVSVNGARCSTAYFRTISTYVEQEDALTGSLTVRETIDFCARLSSTRISSGAARRQIVSQLLSAFGLTNCADVLIGTPLLKGISGGQKRRVSIAAQLVTAPRILFLDEPTSGLDSHASFEVITFLKTIARRLNLIVIASIHQPSTATFILFDNLCLLAAGKTCYFASITQAGSYFASQGFHMPTQINPAEYLLDLVNADFSTSTVYPDERVPQIQNMWARSGQQAELLQLLSNGGNNVIRQEISKLRKEQEAVGFTSILWTLLCRSFIKSHRDVLVYGVRLGMYLGLSILMGTVWIRMDTTQEYIQPFINAIFFGSAFMSFMAVAYIPAYIEDFSVFRKDRENGLYGPLAFQLSNFIIGIPYLFGIAFCFSVISYWLTGFRDSGKAFFTWIAFIFLDLLAAEGLVILVSSIFPVFVVALALVAFANGAWMATGGFLMPLGQLNPFYKFVFHYIDYQAYVFQGMMVNEFKDRTYTCTDCQCDYPTLGLECAVPGVSVLQRYSYPINRQGEWFGIIICIIVAYRMLCLGAVWMRQH